MKYALILMLLSLSANAYAQAALPDTKRDRNQPINIESDHLEVLQADKLAIFSGNVEATQGDLHLKSDEMKVYYKEKTETKERKKDSAATQNAISKIDVKGSVFLATPQETAQGDKGVYDVEKSTITLIDNVVLTRGKNVLKGSTMTYNLTTGRSEMKSEGVGKDGKKQRVRGVFVPEKAKKE